MTPGWWQLQQETKSCSVWLSYRKKQCVQKWTPPQLTIAEPAAAKSRSGIKLGSRGLRGAGRCLIVDCGAFGGGGLQHSSFVLLYVCSNAVLSADSMALVLQFCIWKYKSFCPLVQIMLHKWSPCCSWEQRCAYKLKHRSFVSKKNKKHLSTANYY